MFLYKRSEGNSKKIIDNKTKKKVTTSDTRKVTLQEFDEHMFLKEVV